MKIPTTACFTGHREQHLKMSETKNREQFFALTDKLENAVIDLCLFSGYTDFMSGMALGVDTYAAETVVRLRNYGINVKLICALPCKNQSAFWNDHQKSIYNDLLCRADDVICLEERYSKGCMQRRNEYMIRNSSTLIGVWDGSPGGTASTVKLALKKGIPMIHIDPNNI